MAAQNPSISINSTNAEFGGGGVGVVGDTEAMVGVSKKERAPLLKTQRRLFRSLSGRDISNDNSETPRTSRTLGMFEGVFAPVSLSQFSSLLFLRVGFIVGNLGLLVATGTLTLAYAILLFTILSICAISTNGAVEGGGAYYMISRTLGPEFGGAIGALFFFANVFSSALYASGTVEGLVTNFGEDDGFTSKILPEGYGPRYGYGSAVNFFNLVVCLIGAGFFGKFAILIFIGVLICLASVILSFLVYRYEIEVEIPSNNPIVNGSYQHGIYTGFNLTTWENNWLKTNFSYDYTSCTEDDSHAYDCDINTYASVFGVLFSGVTGIMSGANMSGELKDPGKSIPQGTFYGTLFTYLTYLLLFFLTAATCERFLLNNNYSYMMAINMWPYFITIGVLTATLCASLSNAIGASRILEALVKDNIYGRLTRFIGLASIGNNPIGAVVVSAVLVQCVLLLGTLNQIAKFTSILFLLSYFATNLACLALEWASAPNFRPTFRYFSWWTSVLGMMGNGAMMFVISPLAAGVCIIMCLVLVIILHLQSPSEEHQWGSISQAVIFHQVRKYLLLLDSRKDHVKFWRPQMLLMVKDPRSACPLIDFVNDLKKSGLYVLGHVKLGSYEDDKVDTVGEEYPNWLALVEHLKVKAFVEVTVGSSVREGLHHLVRVSGLGAMKPNTIILGFKDDTPPHDFFSVETSPFQYQATSSSTSSSFSPSQLARPGSPSSASLGTKEYVRMVADVLSLGKNICLCRHFHKMDKPAILKKDKKKFFIDVWPTNFLNPDESNIFGTTSLFLMQLATILNMVSSWRKRTCLRVFLCESLRDADPAAQRKQVQNMLEELRINATIVSVPWDNITAHLTQSSSGEDTEAESESNVNPLGHLTGAYINGVNRMIIEHSIDTAVTFLYLPRPPDAPNLHTRYLDLLTDITEDLVPTVMVHGISAVTTTNL